MEGVEGRIQAAPSSSPINIPVGFNPNNFGGLKWHFGFMTEIKDNTELERVLGIRDEETQEFSYLP